MLIMGNYGVFRGVMPNNSILSNTDNNSKSQFNKKL